MRPQRTQRGHAECAECDGARQGCRAAQWPGPEAALTGEVATKHEHAQKPGAKAPCLDSGGRRRGSGENGGTTAGEDVAGTGEYQHPGADHSHMGTWVRPNAPAKPRASQIGAPANRGNAEDRSSASAYVRRRLMGVEARS